jgi:hypothetical protein
LLFGSLALRFFQPPGCGAKARIFLYKRTPKSLASRRLVDLSVLQQCGLFNFFMKILIGNCCGRSSEKPGLWYGRNSARADLSVNPHISLGTLVAPNLAKHDETLG